MMNLTKILIPAIIILLMNSCISTTFRHYPVYIENEGINTQKIKIVVTDTVDELSLYLLAKDTRQDYNTHKYLNIYFYLPNMKLDKEPYGSASYNPDLRVKLLGFENTTDLNLREIDILKEGNLLGEWDDKDRKEAPDVLIYEYNENYVLVLKYEDNSILERRLKHYKEDGIWKFGYHYGHFNGIHYVINEDKALEIYDKKGKLSTTIEKKNEQDKSP